MAGSSSTETTPVITTRILRRLLASGVHTRVERMLEKIHPADLGPLLGDLTPDEIRTVIDLLFKHHRAGAMLKELPPEMLPEVFETVSDQRLVDLLEGVELDDMLELIEGIPKDRLEAVRALLPDVTLEELRKAEIYPPSSAGRLRVDVTVAMGYSLPGRSSDPSRR